MTQCANVYDVIYCHKSVTLKIVYNKKKNEYSIYFISWSEKMYISFVASPLMKYAFFASLDEIKLMAYSFQKFEYPLCA